jgi:hypothetical protein
MKNSPLLCIALLLSIGSFAQRTVQMRNLWIRPQVHVLYEGYTISFTIKDIDKALALLEATGEKAYGSSCDLDTSKDHYVELYPGYRTEYHTRLQVIMQRAVGAFLISAGRAYIENNKHKAVAGVDMDIQPVMEGVNETDVKFYDKNTGKLLFNGKMPVVMYKKDLGID